MAGAFFRTLPSAGGFSQSAVNKGAGARTQAAALVTVGLALLVGLFLGPVLSLLPQATLAALVFVAVFGLIDVKALRELWRVSRRDFAIAAVTAGVGLTAGLLEAVAVGVVFTLLLVLSILDRPRVALTAKHYDVAIVAVLGPLYTANVLGTERRVLDVVDDVPGLRIMVLDLTVIQGMSVTIIDTLTDLDHELAATGVELRIAGIRVVPPRSPERTPGSRAWSPPGASARLWRTPHPGMGLHRNSDRWRPLRRAPQENQPGLSQYSVYPVALGGAVRTASTAADTLGYTVAASTSSPARPSTSRT